MVPATTDSQPESHPAWAEIVITSRRGRGHGKGVSVLVMSIPETTTETQERITLMKEKGVSDLVRTCSTSFKADLEAEGINYHDLEFPDGLEPSADVVKKWLDILTTCERSGTAAGVHCVAGLGRAPVLAAVALIEAGWNQADAVEEVKRKRPGALNKNHVRFLYEYKRKGRQGSPSCCIVM
eukprot:GHVU01022336.1.p2 GENE.GHVU01022336.1~~GHVU01022336.1.p2  ORF type:complete len:182 (+),score=18.12 GHVU01022336.1:173-718(+)